MTPQEEQRLKEQFIVNNPHANKGLKAAAGHVKLYANNVTSREKEEIKRFWVQTIDVLAEKYAVPQTLDRFVSDVCELRNQMNNRFPDAFVDGEFPFSRAQKSFSVVLKYLWCDNRIAMPPTCPIDRGVLREMGAPYDSWNWTGMTQNQYMLAYTRLQELARDADLSVAQMELLWFSH